MLYIKNIISVLVLITALTVITSCDQIYDSVISFADMSVEESLQNVTDEDLTEVCSSKEYLAALKVTKEKCSKAILSRKKVCLKSAQEKWENKISSKKDLEQMATEYVKCLID